MHCSHCKTVIDKAIMIAKTTYWSGTEQKDDDIIKIFYCKKCFKKEFMNE